MSTFYFVLALTAGVLNLGSGIASISRVKIIYPLLDGVNVPHSMLVFPIGVLKAAGGAGLLAGLVVPPVGVAAAAGLVLFWTCALYSHVLANFWPAQTVMTFMFLGSAIGTLGLGLAV